MTYSTKNGPAQVRALVSGKSLPIGGQVLRLSRTYDLQPSGALPTPVSVTWPLGTDEAAHSTE